MTSNIEKSVEVFNETVQPEGWSMNVRLDLRGKIFENGANYLETRKDLLLAMCLNNGYYKRENVYRMLKFGLAFSDRVQIFTTDGPARHNYRALGRPENEIIRDTRLARNRLRNQCVEGLKRINDELASDKQRLVSFLDWEDIYGDMSYKDSYATLKDLFGTNSDFRADVEKTSKKVLLNRMGIKRDIDAAVSTATEYVLEELAFILSYHSLNSKTKPIADHGQSSFNYIYYEPWSVFENLVNGTYNAQPKEGIGFVVAHIESK